MKLISLILPFYNEEATVSSFFKELDNVINKIKNFSFEFVCVNDGSKDNTLTLLNHQLQTHPQMKIISFSRNFGQEAAVNAGINHCTGEAAVIMDTDLQDPPETIIKFLELYQKGYDVINAKRIHRSTDTFFKKYTAKLFYKIACKCANKIGVEENVNNFRMISSRVINIVKSLTEKNKVFRFQVPFTGFKTTNVLISRAERISGKTHYSISAQFKLAIDSIVAVSTKPLTLISKLFISFLLICVFSSIGEIIVFLIQHFTNLINFNGNIYLCWLIINVVAIFTSFILLSLAIIAQYVARIHLETQNRPIYIIDKIIVSNSKSKNITNKS